MLGGNDTKLALTCPSITLLKHNFPLSQFYCFVKQNMAPVKMYESFYCGLHSMIGCVRKVKWISWKDTNSNGPRSVSPGEVFRDLMVNKDLPVEQAIQRDQISCHQPARGECVPPHLVARDMWCVPQRQRASPAPLRSSSLCAGCVAVQGSLWRSQQQELGLELPSLHTGDTG